jgi:hypothetical protein
MLKQQLALSGYRYSTYVAVSAFFFTCFLGYVSNVAIDTVMKKAIITGCISGFASFVSIRILVTYIPDNFNVVKTSEALKRKDNIDAGQPEE